MARFDLTSEFKESQRRIDLAERQKVAEAAHLEVRGTLHSATSLQQHGLEDSLIGSYRRRTTIWPGKDVDVFGKLTQENIRSIQPDAAYKLFHDVLVKKYGDRVTPQLRSIKVEFGPSTPPGREFLAEKDLRSDQLPDFRFSVDVVPAVKWGDGTWGIPKRNRELWPSDEFENRWRRTDPEELTELTEALNAKTEISGQGAFVPTVKALKQIKRTHLPDSRPSALFYEFMLHEGFGNGEISGDSWADLSASTLEFISNRLTKVQGSPVLDPALQEPYRPTPENSEILVAARVLSELARKANLALTEEKCPAAATWREVLGANGKEGHDSVFPLPEGCRSDGSEIGREAKTNPLRGGSRERSFGDP